MLLFTLPDPVPINPLAVRRRALARLNEAIREIAARRGDVRRRPRRAPGLLGPPALEQDRLHANPEGHHRIAAAAADALGLPDADTSWTDAFTDPVGRRTRRRHAVWFGRYFTPWVIRRLRGRSSGDGRVAKRPELEPYT